MRVVNPWGRRYRPALPPDSPLLVEARAEWTRDALMDRHRDDPRTYVRLVQERALFKNPERLEAPAGWVALLVELTITVVTAVLWERSRREKAMVLAAVALDLRIGARRYARRRAAVRHQLTLADAPRLKLPGCGPPFALSFLHFGLWLRHGRSRPRPTWPYWLAIAIVREVEERLSWRQARRTSTGPPLSSD